MGGLSYLWVGYRWRSTEDTVVTNANCQAVKERFECFLKDRLRREECHMNGHLTYFQAAQEVWPSQNPVCSEFLL